MLLANKPIISFCNGLKPDNSPSPEPMTAKIFMAYVCPQN